MRRDRNLPYGPFSFEKAIAACNARSVLGPPEERLSRVCARVPRGLREPELRRLELAWAGSVTAYWVFIDRPLAVRLRGGRRGRGRARRARSGVLPGRDRGAVRRRRSATAIPASGCCSWSRSLRTLRSPWPPRSRLLGVPPLAVYCLAGVVGTVAVDLPADSGRAPADAVALARGADRREPRADATIESVGIFLGPALGGPAASRRRAPERSSPRDGRRSCACATFLVARIRAPKREPAAEEHASAAARGAAPGSRRSRRDANLRLIVGLYGAQTLVAGALNVLIVVIALELLDLGESGIGFLNSAVGIGGLIGRLRRARARRSPAARARTSGSGSCSWGAADRADRDLSRAADRAAPARHRRGRRNTLVDVAGLTLLQRVGPGRSAARVSSGVVQSVFVGTLGPRGDPRAGALAGLRLARCPDRLPARCCRFSPRSSGDGSRHSTARRPCPTRSSCFRHRPLFRPLPPATLEQLASSLILDQRVGRRTEVFREGDAGDRFYLVGSGEVEVVERRRAGRNRSGPATTSARSPCCATSPGRRRCGRRPTSSCTPSSGTSS